MSMNRERLWETFSVRLEVRVTKTMWSRLQEVMAEREEIKTVVLREAIEEYLEKRGK